MGEGSSGNSDHGQATAAEQRKASEVCFVEPSFHQSHCLGKRRKGTRTVGGHGGSPEGSRQWQHGVTPLALRWPWLPHIWVCDAALRAANIRTTRCRSVVQKSHGVDHADQQQRLILTGAQQRNTLGGWQWEAANFDDGAVAAARFSGADPSLLQHAVHLNAHRNSLVHVAHKAACSLLLFRLPNRYRQCVESHSSAHGAHGLRTA